MESALPRSWGDRLRQPLWRRLIALLLGAAGVFCFAPFGQWWLVFPLWLGLFALLRADTSARSAFITGWCFGFGLFAAGISWVYVSLSVFGGMPAVVAGAATLLFCAAMALYPAAAAAVFKRWQPPGVLAAALLFSASWTLFEALRGWFLTGFPWLSLGYAQAPPSLFAGFAPVLGVYGLSFISVSLAAMLWRWRIGVPLLCLSALAGWGLQSVSWTQPVGAPLKVALVQGNIPQDLKFQPEQFRQTLRIYHELLAQHPAELVVFPETAVPVFYEALPQAAIEEFQRLAARNGSNLILGAPTTDGKNYWNSAISLGSAPSQRYHKQHLVPFGEFLPPGFAWFLAMMHIPLSDFTSGGHGQAPFDFGSVKLATNICYEDVFGSEIAAALPAANLLVNLSNTAWFGRSLAQPQHLQIAQLRALETGRPMLRATNTGMTAVILPNGQVPSALPPFERGVLEASVQPYTGMTPFARVGNGLALGFAALVLGLVMALGWRRRHR